MNNLTTNQRLELLGLNKRQLDSNPVPTYEFFNKKDLKTVFTGTLKDINTYLHHLEKPPLKQFSVYLIYVEDNLKNLMLREIWDSEEKAKQEVKKYKGVSTDIIEVPQSWCCGDKQRGVL